MASARHVDNPCQTKVTQDQITALMPDVDEIARKLAHSMPDSMRGHVAEELAAAGYLAVCEAAKTWKGTGPWKNYALQTARFAMMTARRSELGDTMRHRRGSDALKCCESSALLDLLSEIGD